MTCTSIQLLLDEPWGHVSQADRDATNRPGISPKATSVIQTGYVPSLSTRHAPTSMALGTPNGGLALCRRHRSFTKPGFLRPIGHVPPRHHPLPDTSACKSVSQRPMRRPRPSVPNVPSSQVKLLPTTAVKISKSPHGALDNMGLPQFSREERRIEPCVVDDYLL